MEVYRKMPGENDKDSPAKCRERRRRRIEMRRLAAIQSANSSSSNSQHRKESQTKIFGIEKKRGRKPNKEVLPETSSSSREEYIKPILPSLPIIGAVSVSGRSREMEDAIMTSRWHIGPENRRRLVHLFAVYDGHGGSHVSDLCWEKMHVLVQEELARVMSTLEETESGAVEEEEATWTIVMRRSFERMDEMALNTCACGSIAGQCGCHPMQAAVGGSTAVVAVLTSRHIIVANCGDSRAVLCRGGKAIPLSFDQKPDRIDELARIEKAGGRVLYINGPRVEGILAMSRAIGDKFLKSVVISEPEITFIKRKLDDECLILGSDGLWDVLPNEMACGVARECLQEGEAAASTTIDLNFMPQIEEECAGTPYPTNSALAAALLGRLALGRNSADNISVIVVDLKGAKWKN